MLNINWDCEDPDADDQIHRLCEYYNKLRYENGLRLVDSTHVIMNITACHCNGTPLDLPRMLEADFQSLAQDLNGIDLNVSRVTGRLMNGFFPKYAKT